MRSRDDLDDIPEDGDLPADLPGEQDLGGGKESLGGGQKKYGTIVADPAWPFPVDPNWPYPVVSYDRIIALPVADLAADKAHCFIWSTQQSLRRAFDVMEAWGFQHKITLVWNKSNTGMGFYFRSNTEFVLFGARGNLRTEKSFATGFAGKRREHSRKPEEFMEIVEQTSPGPRLELFARVRRPGWDAWGNEVESDIDLTL